MTLCRLRHCAGYAIVPVTPRPTLSNTMEFIVQMVSADVLKLAPTNCTRVHFVKTNDYNLELIVWVWECGEMRYLVITGLAAKSASSFHGSKKERPSCLQHS